MKLVLDAGALIAIDRGDRHVEADVMAAQRASTEVVTSAPVLGQVWRGGPKQVRLARILKLVRVVAVAIEDAKRAGQLLGRSRTSDVVDALVALLVGSGDEVFTSDPDDIGRLLQASGVAAAVVKV
jgi:predicted nucleic acid-binding protein